MYCMQCEVLALAFLFSNINNSFEFISSQRNYIADRLQNLLR